MAGEVTEGATLLKEKIEQEGSLTVEEAREFLKESGLEGGNLNLALGHGQTKRLGWYHRRDGELFPGAADGSEGSDDHSDIPDPHSLSTPREQFEAVARLMGIPKKVAVTAAFFLDKTYELTDPASTWDGISKMYEIGTAQKKRLWQTWISFLGADVPDDVAKKVERSSAAMSAEARSEAATNGHKPVRRFVAVNGEVLPTDSGDDSAMSFAEAVQAANLQLSGRPAAGNGETLLVAALRESGETTRALINSNAQANQPKGDDGAKATLELMMKWMDSRVDAERERTDGQLKLMTEQNDNANKRMTDALEQVANAVGSRKNPFSELDEVLPGLGAKLLDKLINPPEAAKPGSSLTIGGDGADGDRIVVNSVEDYVQIKKVQHAGAALTMAKESMPKLLTVGERIALAIERSAKAEKDADHQEQPETQQAKCTNPECAEELQVRKGAKAFQCPWCKAVQDLEGNRLDGPMQSQAAAEPEASPTSEPVEGEDPASAAAPTEDEASTEPAAEESERAAVPA